MRDILISILKIVTLVIILAAVSLVNYQPLVAFITPFWFVNALGVNVAVLSVVNLFLNILLLSLPIALLPMLFKQNASTSLGVIALLNPITIYLIFTLPVFYFQIVITLLWLCFGLIAFAQAIKHAYQANFRRTLGLMIISQITGLIAIYLGFTSYFSGSFSNLSLNPVTNMYFWQIWLEYWGSLTLIGIIGLLVILLVFRIVSNFLTSSKIFPTAIGTVIIFFSIIISLPVFQGNLISPNHKYTFAPALQAAITQIRQDNGEFRVLVVEKPKTNNIFLAETGNWADMIDLLVPNDLITESINTSDWSKFGIKYVLDITSGGILTENQDFSGYELNGTHQILGDWEFKLNDNRLERSATVRRDGTISLPAKQTLQLRRLDNRTAQVLLGTDWGSLKINGQERFVAAPTQQLSNIDSTQEIFTVINNRLLGSVVQGSSIDLPETGFNSLRIYSSYDRSNVVNLSNFTGVFDCNNGNSIDVGNQGISLRTNLDTCLILANPSIESTATVLLEFLIDGETNVNAQICVFDLVKNECLVRQHIEDELIAFESDPLWNRDIQIRLYMNRTEIIGEMSVDIQRIILKEYQLVYNQQEAIDIDLNSELSVTAGQELQLSQEVGFSVLDVAGFSVCDLQFSETLRQSYRLDGDTGVVSAEDNWCLSAELRSAPANPKYVCLDNACFASDTGVFETNGIRATVIDGKLYLAGRLTDGTKQFLPETRIIIN